MNAKKTILILCDWFLPGYLAGGPIQSIATLTRHLGNDIDFKIITTDRDFKSGKAYDDVKVNEWTMFAGRQVFYVSPENMNQGFILKLIGDTSHDTLYLNSLFSKLFTVYPLKWKQQGRLKSNIILAPRGMLRDGALAVKPFKKQVYLLYTKLTGLFKNVHWQSTSSQETAEIKKRIGDHVQISEVSNLPAAPAEIKSIEKQPGILKLCFIARIVDIKNLNFAIDVLKEVKDCQVLFDMYGPKEDEPYWEQCEQNAKALQENIVFTYKSVLKPEDIGSTISQYHALFLPTRTENFGHIIVESLQNARPVIISDQTPWRNLQKQNAGFDISLHEKNKFVKAITQLAMMDQTEFDNICRSSASFINEKLNIEEIRKQYLSLFSA
ncbi:MAG: glycosyl transferase group 1 [Bacteroidetes bacterium]|nr:glycosyl transferase group 1 [Bacteroidota bacterium]MDF2450792.1 glycosyl transferase group 1 [Bacteroidota bacterium]